MGLSRTIRVTAFVAGAMSVGLLAVPQAAQATDIVDQISPGSVQRVQLLGPERVLTEDEASAMLEAEGFRILERGRTLLGRIRIVAEGPQGTREVVLHPGSGRVLRDIFTEAERPAAVIVPAETVEVAATEVEVAEVETPPVVEDVSPIEVQAAAAAAEPDAVAEPEPTADVGPAAFEAPAEVGPDAAP